MPRPSRPWFRFYVEAVHDRKLRRLKPEYRWLFVACLAAARQSCKPGVLLVGEDDPMDLTDLADFAGMSSKDTAQGMAALVRVGVLDWDTESAVYSVPAWSERQYESDNVTERTRKHRTKAKERSNDVPGNVPETVEGTPPDTEAETDTEAAASPPALTATERNRRLAAAAEHIGNRAAQRPGVENPGAVRNAVARAIIRDHHEKAYALIAAEPTISPQELADAIEPPPEPVPARPEPVNPTALIPRYEPPPSLTEEERQASLEAMRATKFPLRGEVSA